MWRRVRIYLFGVGLGLLVVFFLFRDGCGTYNYLPEDRIKAELQRYPLAVSERMQCLLQCNEIREWDVEYLLENGDVRVKDSNPRATPRDYVLEGTTDTGKKLSIRFQLADSLTTPINIIKPRSATSCECPE